MTFHLRRSFMSLRRHPTEISLIEFHNVFDNWSFLLSNRRLSSLFFSHRRKKLTFNKATLEHAVCKFVDFHSTSLAVGIMSFEKNVAIVVLSDEIIWSATKAVLQTNITCTICYLLEVTQSDEASVCTCAYLSSRRLRHHFQARAKYTAMREVDMTYVWHTSCW